MGIAGLVLAAALQSTGQAPARHPQPLPEPVVDPVRVEVRVTTAARSLRLRVLGDALIVGDGRRQTGLDAVRATVEGDDLVLGGNTEGATTVVTFRLIVSAAGTTLRLAPTISPTIRPATIEILNLNDEARPARAAELTALHGLELQTPTAALRTGGPLTPPHRDRLVLAHYYPWWDPVAWTSPQLLDQPLRLYSTDSATEVAANLRDVKNAGIDAVIVSYQGSEVGGGWNLRRLRLILDGAQQAGLLVTVQLETLGANRVGREGATPDPDVLHGWIVELVDTIATHPAWLKIDGRPVIFAYVWGFAGDQTWQTVLDRLHAANRRPLMMADSTSPAHLRLADGLSTYAGTLFAPDVKTLMRDTVSATRMYHLLGGGYGAPRVAVSTVMPGYDETRLLNREGRVVPRENGAFYDRQWQAAVASGTDWVVISTWNEWAENTVVEAGRRFGELYVWRTKFWSAVLHGAPR